MNAAENKEADVDKSSVAVKASLDPDGLSRFSVSPFSQNGRLTQVCGIRGKSPAPGRSAPKEGFKENCKSTWRRNRAPLLVVLSQLFAALMNLTARVLELEGEGMQPMQVLFARMSPTVIFSLMYMRLGHVPDAPLGPKEVRYLLVIRGLAGFFGIYGIWYSVMYLPLAEATVITFLAPNLAGYLCHIFIQEPFTRTEQLASFLSLGGVVLITRPDSLFSGETVSQAAAPAATAVSNMTDTISPIPARDPDYVATLSERLSAVAMALLGVLGGAITIMVLRKIGKRAHPLISVNYFSLWCTIVTTVVLSVAPAVDYNQPELAFALPDSARQWAMLLFVAICGFFTQFLLTAGLSGESSNRATAMTYTHMLFAVTFDRLIFGHTMGWVSVTGCAMIVGSALWVVLAKKTDGGEGDGGHMVNVDDVERGRQLAGVEGEGVPMLAHVDDPDRSEEVPMESLSR